MDFQVQWLKNVFVLNNAILLKVLVLIEGGKLNKKKHKIYWNKIQELNRFIILIDCKEIYWININVLLYGIILYTSHYK